MAHSKVEFGLFQTKQLVDQLPPISLEQQTVVNNMKAGKNVTVLSVAGSGKTTCVLHIAEQMPGSRILLMTYNAKLKQETRDRAASLGIPSSRIEVHNYHSFGVNYYPSMYKCHTDSGLNAMLKAQPAPLKPFGYDIIVIDEAQDMNYTYFELICKIYYNSTKPNAQLCVLGDCQQSIFKFNQADERYIALSSRVFKFSRDREWVSTRLPTSFRLTIPHAQFLNRCVLNRKPGDEHTISIKSTYCLPNSTRPIPAPKPRYIICNTFSTSTNKFAHSTTSKGPPKMSAPYNEVMRYLNMGYKPEDMFILAPSIRSTTSPIRNLENDLKKYQPHIQLFVQTDEDGRIDPEVSAGKIVFATFHQTKGLERPVILGFGFDQSYFKWFGKDFDPNLCPNPMYVLVTRSLAHISLFHHFDCEYLQFLNVPLLDTYCDVIIDKPLKISTKVPESKGDLSTSVLDLVRNLPMSVLDECMHTLTIKQVKPPVLPDEVIDIPGKQIQPNGRSESVREITGTFIPCYFEYLRNGCCNMPILEQMMSDSFEDIFTKIEANQRTNTQFRFEPPTRSAETYEPDEDEPHIGGCCFDCSDDDDEDYVEENPKTPNNTLPIFNSDDFNTEFGIAFRTRLKMRSAKQTTIDNRPILISTSSHKSTINDDSDIESDTDMANLPTDVLKPFRLTEIDPRNISVEEAMYISNCWVAYVSGYINPIFQIKQYNWITERNLRKCLHNVESLKLSPDCAFEKRIFTSGANELLGRTLRGVADCINNGHIYEFKCVGSLDARHYLQLVLYMFIENATISPPNRPDNPFNRFKIDNIKHPVEYKNGFLYNILTDELVEVVNNPLQISNVVRILFNAKYSTPPTITDAAFLEDVDNRCRQYLGKYVVEEPVLSEHKIVVENNNPTDYIEAVRSNGCKETSCKKEATITKNEVFATNISPHRCLNGQKVAVTGVTGCSREVIEDLILKHGGKVHAAVSSKTNFLIVESNRPVIDTSKYNAALKKNIPIITETDFLDKLAKSTSTVEYFVLDIQSYTNPEGVEPISDTNKMPLIQKPEPTVPKRQIPVRTPPKCYRCYALKKKCKCV